MNKIAIQGGLGSFHHIAAQRYTENQEIDVIPCNTFENLVGEVKDGVYGLMAMENTLVGSILNNYKLLLNHPLTVIGEISLTIRQNVMSLANSDLKELKEVWSHPMAIAQCRAFFAQYPNIHLLEYHDTALAAKMVADTANKKIGAIASTMAAEIHNLEILEPNIETNKNNFTRFLLVQDRNEVIRFLGNKLSVVFITDHERGALQKVLSLLNDMNINLTKIQSVPIVGSHWEYKFFVDMVKPDDLTREELDQKMNELVKMYHVIGQYKLGYHYDH